MSFLARLSLRNRGLTALVAVLVIGLGALVIPGLKQQLYPSLDLPAAYVVINYPGAAPDIVDRQVVVPVTAGVRELPGVKSTASTSIEGAATVQVNLDYGTDLEESVSKLESALNQLRGQLPASVTTAVYSGSSSNYPVVVLAASSTADERTFANQLQAVVAEIQKIGGVHEAEVTGARAQQVVITPNLAKLAAAGVDVTSIISTLRGNGVATPAGSIAVGAQSLTVQVGAPLVTLDQIRNLYLAPSGVAGTGATTQAAPAPSTSGQSKSPAGSAGPSTPAGSGRPSASPAAAPGGPGRSSAVRLGDVADIVQQLAPATSITRTNGKHSLGVSVTVTPDGNAVRISEEIRKRLPKLRARLGGDTQLTVIFDQAPFVKDSIQGLTREGLLGLVFAVVVILVFLVSIRSTLVTAVSIPLSVVIALIALWAGDYSLNILTLGALTIAVGRVVDDSIVVLENIKRHLEHGEAKAQAVTTAVAEVAGAVTASTITTVAVFAPIALVGGLIGELFSSFAITVTAALLASLLVSLTIIPVLAYWFLKPASPEPASPAEPDSPRSRRRARRGQRRSLLQRGYVPVLRFATSHRLITVAAGCVVLVGTLGLAPRVKTNFFDESGQTSITITQKLPAGSSIATTDAAAQKVEQVLAGRKDIETYQVTVGGGGSFGGDAANSNLATFSLTVKDGVDATRVGDQLHESLAELADVGELRFASSGSSFASDQLQVVVSADDEATLAAATEQVRTAVGKVAGTREVSSDLAVSVPRIEVVLNREKAGRYGMTDTTVAEVVTAVLRGSDLGQVTIDGATHTVVLRLGQAPASLDQIKAFPLVGAAGAVTLGDVAEVKQVSGPVQVARIDGVRSATVTAEVTDSDVGKATSDLTARLGDLTLPAGASYRLGGVSSDQSDAFTNLGLALLAAIAIVYVVMAATFRSLAQPLILLVSIPFAATGAIGLLVATGTALGVPALIGMLMLVGIVVTNAIVLLDLINKYRMDGMAIQDAVIEGGRHRLRPILMTAIATVCALLPMALGFEGSSGFISKPLAIVVIGGLLSSTVLTLVLVPALYTIIERRSSRGGRRWGDAEAAFADGAGGAGFAADGSGVPAKTVAAVAAAVAAASTGRPWDGFHRTASDADGGVDGADRR